MRLINAAERYFICSGSPKVYKVMTAAKDMAFEFIWYEEKWQQKEALEEAK